MTSQFDTLKNTTIYTWQVFSCDIQFFHKEYVLQSLKLSDKCQKIFKNLKRLEFTIIKIRQLLNFLFGMNYSAIRKS